MGVYIRGMEMPTSCRQCSLYLQSMDSERNVYENCAVTAKSYNWGLTTRPSDCPLVPVQPHGDLIDRDALKKKRHWTDDFYETEYVEVEDIDDAPTIIEAEEVYDQYVDTAGNLNWTGTHSGKHIVEAEEGET